MYLDHTPEQQARRRELRAYFGRLVTPEYQAELTQSEGGGPLYMQAVRKLGADGWLGIGWPTEYGGQGRSPIEQFIFFDEAARAGVMLPTLTINAVAPAIMQYGTPAQKAEYLPRILRGEAHFAIGYTEPSAGTDLASLKTRAVRDGDEWVIDGTKVSTVKVFGSEFYVEAYRLLLEVLGETGTLRRGSPDAVLRGRVERMYRATLILTFGGGTNETQRDIIAMAGLSMPRSR